VLRIRDVLAVLHDLVEMPPDPHHHDWDDEASNYGNAPPPPFLLLSLSLLPPTPADVVGIVSNYL
jgi:hypothetical protein